MKILYVSMTLIVSMSPWLFHPLILGIIILVQSIFTSIIIRHFNQSSWLSLTLFLIMVGGLMIIFIYMTSICSNKTFFFKSPNILCLMILLIMLVPSNYEVMQDTISNIDKFNMEYFKIFCSMNWQSSLFMFIFLIFVLMVVVKLINMNKGPLRKKY